MPAWDPACPLDLLPHDAFNVFCRRVGNLHVDASILHVWLNIKNFELSAALELLLEGLEEIVLPQDSNVVPETNPMSQGARVQDGILTPRQRSG